MLLLRCRWGGGLPRTCFWGSPPGGRSGLPPPGAHVAAAPRPVRPWSRGAPVVAPAGPWGARAFQQQQQPPPSRFPLEPRVPRAVILFEHERRRFFGLLGFFCVAQFTFWAVLAHLAFRTWRDTDAKREEQPEPPPQKALLNWGSGKWRYGFSLSCLTVGVLILSAGYLFSRRSVSRILLHRGGQEVSLTTYYPFGWTSSFTVPLRHVCCMSHRSEVRAMIPLKVKGRPFYFLLDKDGRITNAELFDVTVGAYRML